MSRKYLPAITGNIITYYVFHVNGPLVGSSMKQFLGLLVSMLLMWIGWHLLIDSYVTKLLVGAAFVLTGSVAIVWLGGRNADS